jgi:signal transduction histidine kinase
MDAFANLVAGVAHEMNTPLGALISSMNISEECTSILSEAAESDASADLRNSNPKADQALALLAQNSRIAKEAGQRIARLIASLEDFARLDEAEVQRVEIHAGLDTALALITSEMKGTVDIVKDYGDIPEIIGRPRELNQVFMALLANAFQAMNGEGTLKIITASSNENVTVEISDTGTGIDPRKIETLFEIGFETSKGRVGLGLGLPTAFRIVEEHGGSLTVQSEVGKGSRFIVALPQIRLDNLRDRPL